MRTLTGNAPCLFLCPLKTRIKKKQKTKTKQNKKTTTTKKNSGMEWVT